MKLSELNLVLASSEGSEVERRGGFEIRADILLRIALAGSQGMRPTQLMYQTNISWLLLKKHVRHLQFESLVKKEQKERERAKYFVTNKGLEIATKYRDVIEGLGMEPVV